MTTPEKQDNVLGISTEAKYRTIEELIEKGKQDRTYYVMLVLSGLIITAGLLLNNIPIVIGGMLVTPVLIPVLLVALGISVAQPNLIQRTSILIAKSCAMIVAGAFVLALVFGAPEEFTLIENSIRTGILYFVVALASGVAVTYAWIHKEASEILPGIAIAVSLVPPLALIGIGFSMFNFDLAGFYFVVFIFNLFGIVTGSLVVFSLSQFVTANKKVEEKHGEVIIEEHLKDLKKDLDKEIQGS